MAEGRRLIIGGTSHTGKSTLARRLAGLWGCSLVATDALGRHPGRPWPEVRPQVAEFYARLSSETIHWFLQVHHENMRPLLERLAADAVAPVVFEGNALRPEFLGAPGFGGYRKVVLTADDAELRARVLAESGYESADNVGRSMIDRFLDRTLRDNAALVSAATQHRIAVIDTGDAGAPDRLVADLAG